VLAFLLRTYSKNIERYCLRRTENILNPLIAQFIKTDICCVAPYLGTPTGVGNHTALFWELLSRFNSLKSKLVVPGKTSPNITGKSRITIWFANAREAEKTVRKASYLHNHSERNIGYWAWELERMPAEEAANARFFSGN
jgi:hypothetical protein